MVVTHVVSYIYIGSSFAPYGVKVTKLIWIITYKICN